ncbi:MAG: hypothetical protein P9M15_01010, partial [Candidatus Electryoneaceae bacterium]|nr:hypothetical protein [Candidatus Electryoneaceae bacterium]
RQTSRIIRFAASASFPPLQSRGGLREGLRGGDLMVKKHGQQVARATHLSPCFSAARGCLTA